MDDIAGKLIEAQKLFKSFNNDKEHIEILKDADFTIEKGESVAVTGASGIGKSTLLHIIGTLDKPDKGTLLFNGDDVFLYDDIKLARFRNEFIGFVFQFHHLLYEFTTFENAMIPVLINGLSKQKALEKAEDVLIKMGLKDRLNHMVGKLSGGEQQRLALARAIILKPALLLADEPTGNLDKKNSAQIHNLLLELNQNLGMTIVVVTHNEELSGYMSKNITLIDGKLEQIN